MDFLDITPAKLRKDDDNVRSDLLKLTKERTLANEKEYEAEELRVLKLKEKCLNSGDYYVEPEPKVALVVRIRTINRVPPKQKKILDLLRLRQIHNAVFIKLSKATTRMLMTVVP